MTLPTGQQLGKQKLDLAAAELDRSPETTLDEREMERRRNEQGG